MRTLTLAEVNGKVYEDIESAVLLAEKIRKNPEWNLDDCQELCDLAGIIEEWEQADGETFEKVIEKAAEILKVDIY